MPCPRCLPLPQAARLNSIVNQLRLSTYENYLQTVSLCVELIISQLTVVWGVMSNQKQQILAVRASLLETRGMAVSAN